MSGDGNVGDLLELTHGYQGPYQGSRGKVGFLSSHRSGKGSHLTLRGESPGFSPVVAANLGFLFSYDGSSGIHSCGFRKVHSSCELRGSLEIPLQSLPRPRSSSGVEAGTSGFLSSANMDSRIQLEFPQGSQASSHVESCKSALLSSLKSSVRLSVVLT